MSQRLSHWLTVFAAVLVAACIVWLATDGGASPSAASSLSIAPQTPIQSGQQGSDEVRIQQYGCVGFSPFNQAGSLCKSANNPGPTVLSALSENPSSMSGRMALMLSNRLYGSDYLDFVSLNRQCRLLAELSPGAEGCTERSVADLNSAFLSEASEMAGRGNGDAQHALGVYWYLAAENMLSGQAKALSSSADAPASESQLNALRRNMPEFREAISKSKTYFDQASVSGSKDDVYNNIIKKWDL